MLTEGQTKNRTPISHPAKAGATKSKTIEKQNKKKKKKKKKRDNLSGPSPVCRTIHVRY